MAMLLNKKQSSTPQISRTTSLFEKLRNSTIASSPLWSSVQKKFETLLTALRQLKRNECKSALQALVDALPHLEESKFDYNTSEESHLLPMVTDFLLQVWDALLGSLDSLSNVECVYFCKGIISIMKRTEFDVRHLRLSDTLKPQCDPSRLQMAHRYRILLFRTQRYVVTKLAEARTLLKQNLPIISNLTFFSQVLVVNFFRLTGISQVILSAISPSQEEAEAMSRIFADLKQKSTDAHRLQVELLQDCPTLHAWKNFHSVISAVTSDTEDEIQRTASQEWLEELSKKDLLFWAFAQEWVLYLRQILPTTSLYAVNGFRQIVQAFLLSMRRITTPFSRQMIDCSFMLLSGDPGVLNYYLNIVFSRTNVYNIASVNDVLLYLDLWLRDLSRKKMKLSKDFDVQYFCEAIKIVISTDHHQLILRILSILYNYAELFTGHLRRAVFIDSLLAQHFFTLFLHWEPTVRNTFQQILIYKMLTQKRSDLKDGICLRNNAYLGDDPMIIDDDDYENELDGLAFGKIEWYVQTLQQNGNNRVYSSRLSVYVVKALEEYAQYLEMYYRWETEAVQGNLKPPELTLLRSQSSPDIKQAGLNNSDQSNNNSISIATDP